MSSFTAPLVIAYHPEAGGRSKWRVHQAFQYDLGEEGSGISVEVPEGFMTDGASVPRPLWWLLPPWGRYGQATVVHDKLCTDGLVVHKDGPTSKLSRKEVDRVFLEAMGVLGVPKWMRHVMYCGVRIYSIVKGYR